MVQRQMTSRSKSDKGPYSEFSIVSIEGGEQIVDDLIYPVKLRAVFVIGGWRRIAIDRNEFFQLVSVGLEKSQVGEVLVSWDKE